MHNYSGTNAFPANLSLIDDSDDPTASNFNPGHEGNANRTVWLRNRLPINGSLDLSGISTASFVVPPGVLMLGGYGCGGGGGGGAGANDTGGIAGNFYGAGGGGGGALATTQYVAVTPGETLVYAMGAGGSSGDHTAMLLDGGNGGDTTIKRSGTAIMTFVGARGGEGPAVISTSSAQYVFARGGGPTKHSGGGNTPTLADDLQFYATLVVGAGGAGVSQSVLSGRGGNGSLEGYSGGNGGTVGTNGASNYKGGGAGGGGGASSFGAGGNGGTGGDGNASGVGTTATSGAGGSLGAGGGGGGGGGGGTSTASNGGNGGGGGHGSLLLFWTEIGTQ